MKLISLDEVSGVVNDMLRRAATPDVVPMAPRT
jgi:hypothetical protein